MNKITYYKVPATSEELVKKMKSNDRIICWAEAGLPDPPSLGTIRILCSDDIALDATMTWNELDYMIHGDIESLRIDAEAPLIYIAMQLIIEAILANYRICAFIDGIDGNDINIDIFTDMLTPGEVYTQDSIDEICDINNLTPAIGFNYENGIVVRPDGAQVVEKYNHNEQQHICRRR